MNLKPCLGKSITNQGHRRTAVKHYLEIMEFVWDASLEQGHIHSFLEGGGFSGGAMPISQSPMPRSWTNALNDFRLVVCAGHVFVGFKTLKPQILNREI